MGKENCDGNEMWPWQQVSEAGKEERVDTRRARYATARIPNGFTRGKE